MSSPLNKEKILLVFLLHLVLHYTMEKGCNILKIKDLQDLGHRTENPLVLINPKFLIPITPLYYRYLQGCLFLITGKIPFYICVTFIPMFLNRVLCPYEDVTSHFLHFLQNIFLNPLNGGLI